MESEKIKEAVPFSPATYAFNEASDAVPSRRCNGGTQLIPISNISEEQVTEKKEETYFSQDIFFHTEEQIRSTVSNSFEKEASVQLERAHRDPENWAGPSEQERVLIIQEDNLEDSRGPFLNYHQGTLTVAYSFSTHQSFLSSTLAQTPSIPSEAVEGQVETHAFVGFPQPLNSNNTLSQMLHEGTEKIPVSKYNKNTESSEDRSDEYHSLEAQYETDKGILKGMEAIWGMDEMSSKTEESSEMEPKHSRKCEEEKVRELVTLREDAKSYLPHQPSSGCSEDRGIKGEVTQAKPGGLLPHLNTNKNELRQKSFICSTHHLQADEEEGAKGSQMHSVKETLRTKHLKTSEQLNKEEEDDLDRKRVEHKEKTKDKLKLRYSDTQEEQEWGMQVRRTSKKGEQRDEVTALPDMPDLATMYNLENNLTLPDLNQSNSLTEDERSAFSFKVFSLSHCPESCVQTTAMPFATKLTEQYPVNASPSMQPQICHGLREIESSSIYEQAVNEQPVEEKRKVSLTKEVSENVRDEKSIWKTDGEGMAIPCRDLFVMPNSQDQHNSELRECTIDNELCICTSLLGVTIATDPLQKGAGKEASDCTTDDFLLWEESGSIEEPRNKKLPISWQENLVACEEALTVDSDTTVQAPSKNGTCNKYFYKSVQGSACEICRSVSLDEGLSNTSKENVESTPISPLTMQNPLSIQKEDCTITYFEELPQHIETPMKSAEFLGKEARANAFCIKKQVSLNESVLEEDKTEADHNTDIPAFPSTGFRIHTDVTQLKEALAPVPVSDQCLALEPAASHFSELSLSSPCCNQAIQSLMPLDNRSALAQPKAYVLHGSCLHQFLEQVPSFSQTFLAVESFPVKEENPKSDTELFDPDSQCDLNQCRQSLDQYDNNQPISLSINLQKPTAHYVFPEQMGNQSIQQDDFFQLRECTAPGLNDSHLPEHPIFAANRGSYKPPQASRLNKPPVPDCNQFIRQPVEIPESNVPSNCTEGNGDIHTTVPVAKFVSQTTHSIFQSKNLAQIQYMDSGVEENSFVHLAELEEGGALQGQKDWNIPETSSDFGVNLLDAHPDMVILGNYTSIDSTTETMSQVTDIHDPKSSFDHTSHPSVDSQKICEATESRNSGSPPPLLAFTNPIYFLQHGPPSPPYGYPTIPQADSQGAQWQQGQTGYSKTVTSVVTGQLAENTGRFRKGLEKSVVEPICVVAQKTDELAKQPTLEKSNCPDKNAIALGSKESASNSKKQQILIKHRTKSKDWHRYRMRKISVPTDSELDMIASLIPSKEDAHVHKDKADHLDQVKCGEKKPGGAVENIKRRHSKLINSSKVLYQEYSDVALNKAIQNQKRADSLSEDVELESSTSPRLQRKVLPAQDSYLQRLSVSSSTSLWQDIPKVRESTVLLSMTCEEQKLQEAKFELIASEASYLRSLNIAVDHFQHSQELQAVLTNQDRQWLFSRLQDVRDVSANFLFDLEEELEENMFNFNVCNVALRHASEFHRVYLPYVTNQTYQEQTFQRLMNGVPAFQQVLERLENDSVCQRLSLKSFLILPFQRITRLKLLLQNILKRTQPGTEEEVQATQAYDALEKLIRDCNENVQRMKSTEELIYLSQNMEFECKIFPLISQSRRLVKCGELTALEYNLNVKWKLTTRSIYLHLFNDYLLLSRPRENGRFIVFDYAASSDVRGEKCEMKLHGANKNVFRLFLLQNSQGKKVEFLFRTETQSEKLRWISALMPQQTELDPLDDFDAPQVQCVKSYKARENDELVLEKADVIMVLKQSTDGWIEGVKLSDGERGWFPLDHVEFISSKQVRQMNLKEEQRVKNAKQQVFHKK